jgi:5-(carboxyamino)imidazole ribonucleotide synthase
MQGTTTAFAKVTSLEELKQAVDQIGIPAVLKTTRGGYDGKGQVLIHHCAHITDRAAPASDFCTPR